MKLHPSDLGSADKQHLVPKNVANRMSAYPQKRTLHCTAANVRFVPKADKVHRSKNDLRSITSSVVHGFSSRVQQLAAKFNC
jgi:hypothetical protein